MQVQRQVIYEREPQPWTPILYFGKHKGRSVREVASTEEGKSYLMWVYLKCERISGVLKDAIRYELGITR